jgi:Phage tail tube protein
MSIVNSREFSFAFSLNKQTNMETAVANAALNKLRSLRTFSPITEVPANITDRQWYGKGHSHPTFVDKLTKQYTLAAQERSATSLEALYAAAYVMGDVASTQPDDYANPNEWQHVVKWQNPATTKEVRYTSVGEAMGAEYKKVLGGCWINSLTLTGNRADHVMLSYEGGGRHYADGSFDVPELTEASFFKTLHGSVRFGAADALSDISVEVLSWNLTISQNAQLFYLMGNPSGQKDLLSKVLIGDQTVSGSCVIFMNVNHRNRFLNDEVVELEINAVSPDVIDTNPHSLKVQIHNFKIATEAIGEEGQTVSYTLNFGDDTVMKIGSDEHLTLTFISDIDDSELLVAA